MTAISNKTKYSKKCHKHRTTSRIERHAVTPPGRPLSPRAFRPSAVLHFVAIRVVLAPDPTLPRMLRGDDDFRQLQLGDGHLSVPFDITRTKRVTLHRAHRPPQDLQPLLGKLGPSPPHTLPPSLKSELHRHEGVPPSGWYTDSPSATAPSLRERRL